ncbi:MAG TPA: DUF222 domain-containing protein [Sporichthyaceae bacterium]|jgi:hypothetical protein|nr:DUF222 domain-containing protein [Sporichthyaceae bacterium]
MENAVVEAVSELEAAISAARKSVENNLWSCAGSQVSDLLGRVHRLRAQAESMELHLVREVISRGIPAEVGAVNPRAYLMGALTMSPAEATVTVKLAEALGGRLADTGEALAEGAICRERAKAIVEVVTGLPPTASVEEQEEVEAILLESAAGLNAQDLRKMDKVMAAYLDPDGVQPREESAQRKRAAHLRPNGDGTQTLKWTDTDEQMALLQAALEPLTAPHPGPDGQKDIRSPAVRRADALADLVAQVLRHGDLPSSRGARPHLIVTVTQHAFTNGHGLGITATGEHMSAAAVRRISCDADLTAIRLDTDGVPLSMGRTRRIVSAQQWLALVVRDSGCVFPDCTRPAPWTQAHHIVHWSQGGPTDLSNLCLVCDRHHDAIHSGGWDVEIAADGRPELRPPPWTDPDRRPRRNRYWETLTSLHLR